MISSTEIRSAVVAISNTLDARVLELIRFEGDTTRNEIKDMILEDLATYYGRKWVDSEEEAGK